MIFLPFTQGSSSSASGTRVVLPAPGGATSTAALRPPSVRASSPSTASIGRGGSKLRGNIVAPVITRASGRSSKLGSQRLRRLRVLDTPLARGLTTIYFGPDGRRPTLS